MEAMNFELEGSALSLRPLIMTRCDDDRGPKISERRYRPGVLEGNWLEDYAQVLPSIKNERATLYETSYRPYKTDLLIRPKFEAWEQRILTQGIGARLMIDHHGTKYHNNFTTSHDLSYKILPKESLRDPLLRKFNSSNKEQLSVQDYAEIYGNLTEFGLTDSMRHKWALENGSTRSWQTNYQDHFQRHENASSFRYIKPKASLNEPDLSHLGIDLLASHKSCNQ